jgi:hypothetical protein
MNVSPTESAILTALRSFLLAVLPSGTEVVQGQPNRAAEVQGTEFVVMSPPAFVRLETNVDSDADVRFVGSISGTVMTVTQAGGVPDSSTFGAIAVGAAVFGVGVSDNTVVGVGGTGTGGIGTYNVAPAQTVASEVLSSGAKSATQNAEVVVQLDFHSASGAGADMAQTASTLLRDEYGVRLFADQIPAIAVPLYADDPAQRPFFNEQQQVEWRWVLDAHLQVNQTVSVPQQYADQIQVTVIDVDAAYPP